MKEKLRAAFFSAAASWLTCRWKVMGNQISDDPGWDYTLDGWLVGDMSQQQEMALIVKEYCELSAGYRKDREVHRLSVLRQERA